MKSTKKNTHEMMCVIYTTWQFVTNKNTETLNVSGDIMVSKLD